ncbi:hypothetical protein [Tahibacter amnicola]|uniref:Uncharacterized protein n=1 Tax=Tahibacter amnicola TaxID=2976241 RepID=A0ABY6BJM9_9GAMM|nr:hypothetical protein [Tahibacter amnicola]UXI70094.1 hypothetical protein N4264_10835 [Tahibacter amnicola]
MPSNADNCLMQRFVFNNFLYLARDDATGHPRLMTLAPWYEAIPRDGSAPAWKAGYKPLSPTALRKTAHEGEAGDGFALLAADGRRVAFDIRVNRTFLDYIAASGTYKASVLQAMASAFQANPASGGVWLPGGSATQEGAVTVKTSWRRFATECPVERMHCEKDSKGHWWGLIGVHLVQKTPILGEMTWATFEHVANAPDCAPGGTRAIAPAPHDPANPDRLLEGGWNLFDWERYRAAGGDGRRCPVPDGAYIYTVAADGQTLQDQGCGAPTAPPLCNTDPRQPLVDGVAHDGFYRINVCRTQPQPPCTGSGSAADVVACLNADFAQHFPPGLAAKWRHYFLVGSEYVLPHPPGTGCFRYDDGPVLTTTPPRSRFPSSCNGLSTSPLVTREGNTAVANTSMETWMQPGTCLVSSPGSTPLMGRDCLACHTPATNPPGWPFGMGDMSFLFDRVRLPAPQEGSP